MTASTFLFPQPPTQLLSSPLFPPAPIIHQQQQPFSVVDQWKQTITSTHKHKSNTTVIPEVITNLKTTLTCLNRLRDIYSRLCSCNATDSNELWSEVAELKSVINECTSSSHLDETVLKRKIMRNKRRRKQRKVNRKLDEQRRRKIEKECSEWLTKKQNDAIRKKLEESVEREASGSLGEVRKKIMDMNNVKSLVEAMKDLREHRVSKQWKIEGLDVTNSESFNQSCSDILELVSTRLKIYNEEEHALQVMMSEQVDAKLTKATNTASTPAAVQDPVFDYYHQAKQSVERFVSIRSQWDMYLSPHGSTLPNKWLEPTMPSSDGWAACLNK